MIRKREASPLFFLYNRKLHFLLYKKPPAGCALARIRIMSQASPYSLRSLLDERHWRSATRSARECAKVHSLFYPDKSLRTFSLLTSGQSAGDMQTADRKNLNKEKETKL